MLLGDSDINRAICFSGPRPIKYSYTEARLEKLNSVLYSVITGLLRSGCDTLIFGGAPGFDLYSLKAALHIKEKSEYKNIRLVCALPYERFSESKHFNSYWRSIYHELIPQCEIINAGDSIEEYSGCFRRRNYFMVDNSGTLVCLYNGNRYGGTAQTHLYAVKEGRRIINIYDKIEL